ncbi:Protein of unknown function [Gryllus bimaculatus]|nr:Protein of unknown function [Gryllus bimaculatus]
MACPPVSARSPTPVHAIVRVRVKSIPFLATSPGKDRVVLVYSDKIEVRTKKHQRGATPESTAHDEELNDIQIRMQSNRSPPSEPTPDRLSRASLNQTNSGGGTGAGTGGTGGGGSASLVSISKPNSTTSSTMTASVVVNLPASYPGSEVEPTSPASPSASPATSPDQQPEVRISTL